MIRYEIAKLELSTYKDAPYFIVKSEVTGKKRAHAVLAGRYKTPRAAQKRVAQLEDAAT
jgi:hypothetical protein